MWIVNFQVFKLDFEKAEEQQVIEVQKKTKTKTWLHRGKLLSQEFIQNTETHTPPFIHPYFNNSFIHSLIHSHCSVKTVLSGHQTKSWEDYKNLNFTSNHFCPPPLKHKHYIDKNSLASWQIWAELFSLLKLSLNVKNYSAFPVSPALRYSNYLLYPPGTIFTTMLSFRWQKISMDEPFSMAITLPPGYPVLCVCAWPEYLKILTLLFFSIWTTPVRWQAPS